MSKIVELSAELETKLAVQASQRGLSPADYLLRLLKNDGPMTASAQSGADLVAYWQQEDLIGTRSEITDSAEHARSLRQQAESRHRG